MTLVVDASVVVVALVDTGRDGLWAEQILTHHGNLDDLLELTVRYTAPHPLLDRSWELRHNITAYDFCDVALAEVLEAPLVTLGGGLPSRRRTVRS